MAPEGSANMVRGACGLFLRKLAPPDVYSRLFEPGRSLGGERAPSGLADWPRPFVLRTRCLDALDAAANDVFFLDLHVFDVRQPALPYFQEALGAWAEGGIGPARGRARLYRVEQLGLDDRPGKEAACSLPLNPEPSLTNGVILRFLTPTELKSAGEVVERPEFGVLFARIRDRICALRAGFGAGPLALDFRGMGERAARISLARCDLEWRQLRRSSSRTGQTHPLGGFTGEAEYQGVLAEFLPWLRAAQWTGVGRQTVWGKGELRIEREMEPGKPPGPPSDLR